MLRTFVGPVLLVSAAVIGSQALAADSPRPITVLPPSYDVLFGLYGGRGVIEAQESNNDDEIHPYRIFGAEGSVNLSLGPHALYIDGRGESGAETTFDTYGGTQTGAHLYFGSAGTHTFGVLGAIALDQQDDQWNVHGLIGAEVGFRHSIFGLGVQGGWIGTIQTEGADRLGDAAFVRGVAQVFGGPAWKVQGELAYLKGHFDSDLDRFHMVTAGAEAEFKVHTRASLFLSWDAQWTTDDTWRGTLHTDQVLGGVRFALGGIGGMGVPMNTPNLIRWNAIAARNN